MSRLRGRKILLGISGSIAAYKSALLCRLLIKEEAEVRVVMTDGARQFITPLTLSTLSGHSVYSDLMNADEWNNHVELGLWADYLLIAPATAQTLASAASGLCPNMLLAVYLSAKCAVLFAPAMDRDMWNHPATQANISALKSFGNEIISPEHGYLASGLIGEGRLAEPDHIVQYLVDKVSQSIRLEGVNVLINAGPTYEDIDPVRFIGNRSTGKMGMELARAYHAHGATVTLVLGPSYLNDSRFNIVKVRSASEMHQEMIRRSKEHEIIILAAAVADFTPSEFSDTKIKKKNHDSDLTLRLERTIDIAKDIGSIKLNNQCLVGFALETNDAEKNALRKLKSKNLDFIVLNSLEDEGAGFAHNTNQVRIYSSYGMVRESGLKSKSDVAQIIIDTIQEHRKSRDHKI